MSKILKVKIINKYIIIIKMNINDELINENNEGLFFEYGAHFKYRDLYDRLYILSKNINNENWKKKNQTQLLIKRIIIL